MPNFTTNLNLEKPLTNENYNIEVFNANADKLDTAIKEVSSKVDNFETPVKSVNGKTGAVTLAATDIKTVDGKTLEQFKADASSQLDTIKNEFAEVEEIYIGNDKNFTVNDIDMSLYRSLEILYGINGFNTLNSVLTLKINGTIFAGGSNSSVCSLVGKLFFKEGKAYSTRQQGFYNSTSGKVELTNRIEVYTLANWDKIKIECTSYTDPIQIIILGVKK